MLENGGLPLMHVADNSTERRRTTPAEYGSPNVIVIVTGTGKMSQQLRVKGSIESRLCAKQLTWMTSCSGMICYSRRPCAWPKPDDGERRNGMIPQFQQ